MGRAIRHRASLARIPCPRRLWLGRRESRRGPSLAQRKPASRGRARSPRAGGDRTGFRADDNCAALESRNPRGDRPPMSDEFSPAGREYFRWFYDQGVWKRMHYRGARILKVPSDLWNYQEIFVERRIEWVIETGTLHGGSALFFADLLALNGAPGRVISIDADGAA